jgi:hypothetical protein
LGIPSFQWRKNGVAINTAANPSAATNTLSLPSVQPDDAGTYDCVISYYCGVNGTSNAAELSFVTPQCGSADFDGDGDLGTDADIEAFFRVLGGGDC